ncbi:MAG: MFS transporter [Armatimonadetes bacterium]|nr:MFS transporter [Armatimonadota bacterium]MDW8154634.1 MFS transporter [Armatimonadota bacterium]
MNRPLVIIFLTVLTNLIGFGIVIPLLPYYARALGASPVVIGLLFASYSACQLLAAPVLGVWSDRWGRRPVLLLSLLGTALSFVLLALAHSVGMLFAARIIDGLSGGNISTARAYIADVTPAEDRARAFGLIGAAFGLGFIVGPALGGVLAHLSYAAPAWVAAGVTLGAAILAWLWLPETVHRVSASRGPVWRELPRLLRHPHLGPLLGVDFLYWATASVYQTTFALFVSHRFGFGPGQAGVLLALWGFVGAVVQVGVVGPVVRRVGEGRALAMGLLLAGLGLGAAAASHTATLFVLSTLPAALGAGVSNPALVALLSRSARPGEQGVVQGVASTLESLGRMVGPIWGNGTLGAFGEGAAFSSAAAVMALTGLLALRLRPLPAPCETPARMLSLRR